LYKIGKLVSGFKLCVFIGLSTNLMAHNFSEVSSTTGDNYQISNKEDLKNMSHKNKYDNIKMTLYLFTH